MKGWVKLNKIIYACRIFHCNNKRPAKCYVLAFFWKYFGNFQSICFSKNSKDTAPIDEYGFWSALVKNGLTAWRPYPGPLPLTNMDLWYLCCKI